MELCRPAPLPCRSFTSVQMFHTHTQTLSPSRGRGPKIIPDQTKTIPDQKNIPDQKKTDRKKEGRKEGKEGRKEGRNLQHYTKEQVRYSHSALGGGAAPLFLF